MYIRGVLQQYIIMHCNGLYIQHTIGIENELVQTRKKPGLMEEMCCACQAVY